MSAETTCPSCEASVPATAKFCPECGRRLASDTSETVAEPLPPNETGTVPVEVVRPEPTLFGAPPATALLAVGAAAVGVAIVLLALGSIAAGLIVLAGGLLALAGFAGAASRRADTAVARRSARALDELRARASFLGTSFAARSEARRRVSALMRELDDLGRERETRLRLLGDAVYRSDDPATESLRREIEAIDAAAAEKRAEVERIVSEAQQQIGQARLETSRTEVVAVQEPYPPPGEADPPEPARVPEPYPPPGEADPPEPARIPEPSPPPDEGDLPQPPQVPEPSPGQPNDKT